LFFHSDQNGREPPNELGRSSRFDVRAGTGHSPADIVGGRCVGDRGERDEGGKSRKEPAVEMENWCHMRERRLRVPDGCRPIRGG